MSTIFDKMKSNIARNSKNEQQNKQADVKPEAVTPQQKTRKK